MMRFLDIYSGHNKLFVILFYSQTTKCTILKIFVILGSVLELELTPTLFRNQNDDAIYFIPLAQISVAMNGKSIIIILVGNHTSILYLYPKQIDNLVLEYVFHHR